MKNDNLWAPWRVEYLKSLDATESSDRPAECFLCDYWSDPQKDNENLVLWRTGSCMILLNRFPYTGGHMLIAPGNHIADMDHLAESELLEMMLLCRDIQRALRDCINPQGFNVGFNINRCAGAGLPGHIHLHVVPRWEGDTNFMSVCGDVRVISQGLEDIFAHLRKSSEKLGLPGTIER